MISVILTEFCRFCENQIKNRIKKLKKVVDISKSL